MRRSLNIFTAAAVTKSIQKYEIRDVLMVNFPVKSILTFFKVAELKSNFNLWRILCIYCEVSILKYLLRKLG